MMITLSLPCIGSEHHSFCYFSWVFDPKAARRLSLKEFSSRDFAESSLCCRHTAPLLFPCMLLHHGGPLHRLSSLHGEHFLWMTAWPSSSFNIASITLFYEPSLVTVFKWQFAFWPYVHLVSLCCQGGGSFLFSSFAVAQYPEQCLAYRDAQPTITEGIMRY